jgi:hypothetical protein
MNFFIRHPSAFILAFATVALRRLSYPLQLRGSRGIPAPPLSPPILDFGLPILDWALNLKSKI